MNYTVEGVILAAGLSTRMGKPKLLLDMHGHTVLWWVVRAALESDLAGVILVVGSDFEADTIGLGNLKAASNLHIIGNPQPERGMSSSLIAGLAHVDKGSAGALILLGDQPGITNAVINDLIAAFQRNAESIVVPTVQGRRTTPVLFPRSLFPDLMRVRGDVGGREVLNSHPDRVVLVETGPYYDDTDMDTPADLEKLQPNFPGRKVK
ncbi:MAG: nucleotidyltransferase family protein [Thermodesulfobacteriota bacterium]